MKVDDHLKPVAPSDRFPTLKDIGLTKSQSSRWQQKAALPKDEQEALTSASGAKGVTVKNDSRPQ